MKILCPFFKDECKGNECAMWKDEKCLIISFMEHIVTVPEEFEERAPIIPEIGGMREVEIPDEIKSATPEELAVELISFVKKELSGEERMFVRKVSQLFWGDKNVERWRMPPEIRLKMEKAEMLSQKQLDTEREIKEREQLEKEKTGLSSLVNLCVDWAKERGLKRVTQADVEAFLMEKNVEILRQTRKSLYALVNVKLRSKR